MAKNNEQRTITVGEVLQGTAELMQFDMIGMRSEEGDERELIKRVGDYLMSHYGSSIEDIPMDQKAPEELLDLYRPVAKRLGLQLYVVDRIGSFCNADAFIRTDARYQDHSMPEPYNPFTPDSEDQSRETGSSEEEQEQGT